MPVLYWNDVALEANKESHSNGAGEQTGPTLSSRALAIVHLAIHDAVVGINGGFTPYLTGLPAAPPPAATASAVAWAAYKTLVALFPAQTGMLTAKLAAAPVSTTPDDVPGQAYGLAIAKAVLDLRKNDDNGTSPGHVASQARFRHRPDPDNAQGFHAAYYGDTTALFATHGTPPALLAPPLPPTDLAEYNKAVAQVYRNGIKQELAGTLPNTGDRRTPTETLIGVFWGYDGAKGLGTPPRLYNQMVRKVVAAQETLLGTVGTALTIRQARILALVNVAMADAGILAWREKYKWDVWRPVVGIREHDDSTGPQGTGSPNLSVSADPFWLPLGAPRSNEPGTKNVTPPFPAYPSGHATFGAAAFHVTRRFYGVTDPSADTLCNGLEFVSDELNGKTTDNNGTIRPRHARKFPQGLWQAIRENGLSRVYLGVHWVFDAFRDGDNDFTEMIGGIPLGLKIADNVFDNNLSQP